MNDDTSTNWAFKSGTKKALWGLLIGLCFLSVFAETIVHLHPHFEIEETRFFYAILAVVSCVILTLVAKAVHYFFKAPNNYYENDDN